MATCLSQGMLLWQTSSKAQASVKISYLTEQTVCVCLGYYVSTSAPLSCGIPQGSVLEPLLFFFFFFLTPLHPILEIMEFIFIVMQCHNTNAKLMSPKYKDIFPLKTLSWRLKNHGPGCSKFKLKDWNYGFGSSTYTPCVALDPLAHYIKPNIKFNKVWSISNSFQ